jgi:HicA toxin of bacterial toxin-antitoxin,
MDQRYDARQSLEEKGARLKDYGKPVRKILSEAGCELLRQGRGDHEIWISPNTEKPFTVPVTTPSRHLANKIIKEGRGLAEGVLKVKTRRTGPLKDGYPNERSY